MNSFQNFSKLFKKNNSNFKLSKVESLKTAPEYIQLLTDYLESYDKIAEEDKEIIRLALKMYLKTNITINEQ